MLRHKSFLSWLEEQGGSKWLGLDQFICTMMIENMIEYFQLVLKIELPFG